MAVTSNRTIQVEFSGDVAYDQPFSALESAVSPGVINIITLDLGVNTIASPLVDGIIIKALTIIPPAGNVLLMTLKGVAGDTGIELHKTDPTSIALDTTFISLVIDAEDEIIGVRLIWS